MGKTKIKIPAADIDYRYQKTVSFFTIFYFQALSASVVSKLCQEEVWLSSFYPHDVWNCYSRKLYNTILKLLYDESAAAADRIDIEPYFKERFITNYKESLKNNENKHYSTSEEMQEFYSDGTTLLDWFKREEVSTLTSVMKNS